MLVRIAAFILWSVTVVLCAPPVLASSYGPLFQPSPKREGVMVRGVLLAPDVTVFENLKQAKNLSTVLRAVKAASLTSTFKGEEHYTIFAPSNAAFQKLPAGSVADVLQPENKGGLADLLTYHLVEGDLRSTKLRHGTTLKTVEGGLLYVTKKGDDIWINDAKVQIADIVSSNGIIHVIDRVLLP